jgi:uncharacterized protein
VRRDPSKVVSVARQPTPALDRPWHRPGAFGYAVARLRGFARPPVTVTEPPEEIVIDCDAAIVTATDGVARQRHPAARRRALSYGPEHPPVRQGQSADAARQAVDVFISAPRFASTRAGIA